MNEPVSSEGLSKLRADFDAAFGLPFPAPKAAGDPVVLIRCGRERIGMRLAHLGGLHRGAWILPVPSTSSGFLGIANLAGRLASVFDLGMLLGEPPRPTRTPKETWLAQVRSPAIALAFDGLDGLVAIADGANVVPARDQRPWAEIELPGEGPLRLVDVDDLARRLAQMAGSR